MDYNDRVFASVFSVPSVSHTTPTPIATPDLGNAEPGESFGGGLFGGNLGNPQRKVKRNLAWSTATRFLSLPKGNHADTDPSNVENEERPNTAEVQDALEYLLVGDGKPEIFTEDNLLDWFIDEAQLHFATFARSEVEQWWNEEIPLEAAWDTLETTQRLLQHAQNVYLRPLAEHILPLLNDTVEPESRTLPPEYRVSERNNASRRFLSALHGAFVHSLPSQRFSKTLSYVLYDAGLKVFRIPKGKKNKVVANSAHEGSRRRMQDLLQGLDRVGLGGDKAQKSFAHAMDKLLDAFINSHYLRVDWHGKESELESLRMWISKAFIPLIELVNTCLRCHPTSLSAPEIQHWHDAALGRLGRAKVEYLFEYASDYHTSRGVLKTIKEYMKLPNAKQYLTTRFSEHVSRRLLSPGATTTYILDLYMCFIRTFLYLDPKGVLLERVARPIRRYLKEREDTARIIITSMLADAAAENNGKFSSAGDLSVEIATEMQRPITSFEHDVSQGLDWDNMNWQPSPTDAAPDYKQQKGHDIILFVLTLWERDDFINELKNILGDHLLRSQDPEYANEIRLLELIKVRLGDDKLQACEVMLRDVLESKRINSAIRAPIAQMRTPDNRALQAPGGPPRTPQPRQPVASIPSVPGLGTPLPKSSVDMTLNAHIISSFFWPSLRDDHFLIPAEVQNMQRDYESRFTHIKGRQKLQWKNALGDGSVALELDDRTEQFDGLMPWQVSVIYAFQPQPGEEWVGKGKGKGKELGISRNVEQLEEMLEMDEQLVRQALAFWVGKQILREMDHDTFAVIERLTSANMDTEAAAAAQELAEVQAQAQAGSVKSQHDLLQEKKDVYMTFITSMLTNQGNLPVQRIAMMMKIMVAGGFPFGPEEVTILLEELENEGKVIGIGGDIWGIKK
ncbi:hypothetical protein EJ04DRAFT_541611 [Polyplosphaeria fusca]|uniref:Anaphase-promoting complex subunit 2 n=1 Tax=Polyplosphaeria fusca TaxID=682080 RepID=A0A9P4R709_9PLEO|nr:hypothetical protein EJ04DRAFT_541611 [Polyplosphaeria fusca]